MLLDSSFVPHFVDGTNKAYARLFSAKKKNKNENEDDFQYTKRSEKNIVQFYMLLLNEMRTLIVIRLHNYC